MDLTRLVEGLEDTTPIVRTDFSDDVAWRQVVERLVTPSATEEYEPSVAPVEDRAFASATGKSLAAAAATVGPIGYVLLADERSDRPPAARSGPRRRRSRPPAAEASFPDRTGPS